FLTTSPATSDSISFISFMASTMHKTWPTSTASPGFTKGGDPGDGDSYNVPTMGERTVWSGPSPLASDSLGVPGTAGEVMGCATAFSGIDDAACTAMVRVSCAGALKFGARLIRTFTSPRSSSTSAISCSFKNSMSSLISFRFIVYGGTSLCLRARPERRAELPGQFVPGNYDCHTTAISSL